MADLYWYSIGIPSAHWDEVLNWWQDSAHTVPALAIPTTNDSAYIYGANMPDTPPSVAVTLQNFYTSSADAGTSISTAVTAGITLAHDGGPGLGLILGVLGDATSDHAWAGNTVDNSTWALFQGGASVQGASGGFARATWKNNARMQGGALVVTGLCLFQDTATMPGGQLTADPNFAITCSCSGTIIGNPTFARPLDVADCNVTGDTTINGSVGPLQGTFNGELLGTGVGSGGGGLLRSPGTTGGING